MVESSSLLAGGLITVSVACFGWCSYNLIKRYEILNKISSGTFSTVSAVIEHLDKHNLDEIEIASVTGVVVSNSKPINSKYLGELGRYLKGVAIDEKTSEHVAGGLRLVSHYHNQIPFSLTDGKKSISLLFPDIPDDCLTVVYEVSQILGSRRREVSERLLKMDTVLTVVGAVKRHFNEGTCYVLEPRDGLPFYLTSGSPADVVKFLESKYGVVYLRAGLWIAGGVGLLLWLYLMLRDNKRRDKKL